MESESSYASRVAAQYELDAERLRNQVNQAYHKLSLEQRVALEKVQSYLNLLGHFQLVQGKELAAKWLAQNL